MARSPDRELRWFWFKKGKKGKRENRENREGKGKVKASNQAAEGQKTKESLEGGCSLKAPKAPKVLAWMEDVCPRALVLARL